MASGQIVIAQGILDFHLLYEQFVAEWQTMRDVVSGDKAIKDQGETYLPKLDEETTTEYDARKKRAVVYEATDKTLDALLGALFRKPATDELPSAFDDHMENIDLSGTEYEGFRQEIASEFLEVGRTGVLIDWNEMEGRPFWRPYETEQIRNWVEVIVDGKRVVQQIVLAEIVTERVPDGFGAIQYEQFRVLELDEAGRYVSRIFKADSQAPRSGLGNQPAPRYVEDLEQFSMPTRQGVPWDEIPFVCFGQLNLSLCPKKPPLLPIANLQLDHYQLGVDLKHALHLTALGGLFIIGDATTADENKKYYLGGTRANQISQGADAKFVEFTGAGVKMIREEMNADEQRMALLGVRMLMSPKRAAEAAETLEIQREGETASLSTISYMLSLGLTKCWRFHARWLGIEESTVETKLNRDFRVHEMDADMVAAQLALVQAGKLSTQSFLENLFEGEISEEPDEELKRLAAEEAEQAAKDAANPPDTGGDMQPPDQGQPQDQQQGNGAMPA